MQNRCSLWSLGQVPLPSCDVTLQHTVHNCYRIESIVLPDFNCAIYSRRSKVMLTSENPPNIASCDPFTRNRASGGWVAKGRRPAVPNFDNCVPIQVRRRTRQLLTSRRRSDRIALRCACGERMAECKGEKGISCQPRAARPQAGDYPFDKLRGTDSASEGVVEAS